MKKNKALPKYQAAGVTRAGKLGGHRLMELAKQAIEELKFVQSIELESTGIKKGLSELMGRSQLSKGLGYAYEDLEKLSRGISLGGVKTKPSAATSFDYKDMSPEQIQEIMQKLNDGMNLKHVEQGAYNAIPGLKNDPRGSLGPKYGPRVTGEDQHIIPEVRPDGTYKKGGAVKGPNLLHNVSSCIRSDWNKNK